MKIRVSLELLHALAKGDDEDGDEDDSSDSDTSDKSKGDAKKDKDDGGDDSKPASKGAKPDKSKGKKDGKPAPKPKPVKKFKDDPAARRDRQVFTFLSKPLQRPVNAPTIGKLVVRKHKNGNLIVTDQGGSVPYEISKQSIQAGLSGHGMSVDDLVNWMQDQGATIKQV